MYFGGGDCVLGTPAVFPETTVDLSVLLQRDRVRANHRLCAGFETLRRRRRSRRFSRLDLGHPFRMLPDSPSRPQAGAETATAAPQAPASRWRDELAVAPVENDRRADLKSASYNSTRRRRSAFPTTDSELKVIAALAQMGLISRPMNG